MAACGLVGSDFDMRIVPKDWREFQHYKDRSPPWIRLHKKLLDNYEFHCLPVASRALAPMLWLLASDSIDGFIEASPEKLAFRLRQTEKEVTAALRPLIDNGFFVVDQGDSSVLADRKQSAVPETEAEALQRTETETTPRKRSASPVQKTMATLEQLAEAGIPADVAAEFIAHKAGVKAPLTERAWLDHLAEAKKAGWSPLQAAEKVMAKSWKGFEAKYVANEQIPGKQAFTSFAQQAADIARTTVPSKPGRDPNLLKIEEDAKRAVPIPENIREKLAALKGGVLQ